MSRTYTIRWSRVGDPEELSCSGLSPRVLVARLRGGCRNNPKGIVVHSVEADGGGLVPLVGDTIYIRDLATYGVVTWIAGEGRDAVLVCQIADRGCPGDWATVPIEQAEPRGAEQ